MGRGPSDECCRGSVARICEMTELAHGPKDRVAGGLDSPLLALPRKYAPTASEAANSSPAATPRPMYSAVRRRTGVVTAVLVPDPSAGRGVAAPRGGSGAVVATAFRAVDTGPTRTLPGVGCGRATTPDPTGRDAVW